jgi:hypothetical protein
VNVVPEMMRLTLQIVGLALMSMDLTAQAEVIGRNMTIANERFGNMGLSAFAPWFPTQGNVRFRNAALYEPVPVRAPRQHGRPCKKGARRPTLLTDAGPPCH